MSTTTSKLANKTKSKSKLHHFGNHTQKQSNDHTKKNANTKNTSTLIRRPMTPSVEYLRYPEPEIILKQIQKNVNVLKQIYEASVSERNGFQGKRSVPGINFPISESVDPKKKKNVQEKPQQKIKSLNKCKSESQQNFIKIFEDRRKSIANIREQVSTIKNLQRKSSNSGTQKKEDESCQQLLQIFNFYKRSIDSSISKYSNPINVHSNDVKNSLLSDHNNYQSLQNKSDAKQTPHNSSTKIATNHKASSIDPSFQGQIGGDIWKEDDEATCNKRNGAHPRSNERKVLPLKKKTAKDSAKSSRVSSQQQKKQSSKDKFKKQEIKSYNQDLLTQVSKDKIAKNDKKKILKQKPKQNASNDISKPTKLAKKKPQIIQFEIQKFDFPEIQSSVFHRDMPILEEDSRQQLSSSLIIVPGNSINSSTSSQYHGESPHKTKDKKENEQQYFLSKRNSIFNQQNIVNDELMEKAKKSTSEFLLYSSKNKKTSPEQNTRFPTPSFMTSQLSNEMLQIETNAKQNQPLVFEDSDGSLAGCEIPKDRSDSFALEEFETASFDI